MVFRKFNEDKQRNRVEVKASNKRVEVSLRLNIQQFFDEELQKSRIRRLDKNSRTELIGESFEQLCNNKSVSAFTITFQKHLQDKFTEEQLRKYVISNIDNIVFNENIPIEIAMLPDMDTDGNFHYHGCIKMPIKYRMRFKQLCTKYIGFVKFKYIENIDGWVNYCYKIGLDHKGRERERVYNNKDVDKLGFYMLNNPDIEQEDGYNHNVVDSFYRRCPIAPRTDLKIK